MNTLLKGLGSRRPLSNRTIKSGYILLLALLLGAPATLAARTATEVRTVPGHDSLAVVSSSPAPRLKVAMYQVLNTSQVKLHFAQNVASPVKIQLENDKGVVLYKETSDQSVYIRKFDLSALPDACYYFALQTGGERQVKEVLIQTHAVRNLVVR